MHSELAGKNAVAAIQVSTFKQGTDGDSPEAQKEAKSSGSPRLKA